MFNFFKRKADVLNHRICFVDGFQTSLAEFYASLEKEIAERQVLSMEMSRIEFPEVGLLSEKRIYLRTLRERLDFDVCAAPFGGGFFFSSRTAEIPVAPKWRHLLLLAKACCIVHVLLWLLFYQFNGWFWLSLFAVLLLCGVAVYTLRNAVALGLAGLGTALVNTPVDGPLSEVFFHKETYHRIDSRMCYLEVVPMLVKKLAEDVTTATSAWLLPCRRRLYRCNVAEFPQKLGALVARGRSRGGGAMRTKYFASHCRADALSGTLPSRSYRKWRDGIGGLLAAMPFKRSGQFWSLDGLKHLFTPISPPQRPREELSNPAFQPKQLRLRRIKSRVKQSIDIRLACV